MIINNDSIELFFDNHKFINPEEILLSFIRLYDKIDKNLNSNENYSDYTLNKMIEDKLDKNYNLIEKYILLSNAGSKNTNTSLVEKGTEAEKDIYTKLSKLMEDENIEHVASEDHDMDILIHKKQCENKDIRLEIKNYTKSVPKQQIDKFYNDIDTTNSHGIMISLNSGISCKKNMTFEIKKNDNICFFLTYNNYDADNIKNIIHIIRQLECVIKSMNISNNLTKADKKLIIKDIKSNIERIKNLDDNIQKSKKLIKQINFDKILTLLIDKLN